LTQLENAEPEDLSWTDRFSKEASCFAALGIREHAALVQAIMLNFPEIYEKTDVGGRNKSPVIVRVEPSKWDKAGFSKNGSQSASLNLD